MSFQPLNIIIREAKLTNWLTDITAIFNTNDSKIKTELEKVVNGLQINATTGVIGEPSTSGLIPINEINSRTMFMVLPSSPSTGAKWGFKNSYNGSVVSGVNYESTANEPWSVSFASQVYSLTMGVQSAGYRAYFDRITVATVMQAMFGKFDMIQLSNAAGLLDCSAVAQFNGLVIHRSGHKESVSDSPLLMQVDGTKLYCEYTIGRNTPENVFVYLQFDANGYSSGWVPTVTNIEMRLKIDPAVPSNMPLSGQVFNFVLRGITDDLNNPITLHPDVDIVVKAAKSDTINDDFQWKNYGANGAHTPVTEIVFVPKSADVTTDSLDTYASSLSLMYNVETPFNSSIYTNSNILYVKNHFTKE